jgi:hypothetical protein
MIVLVRRAISGNSNELIPLRKAVFVETNQGGLTNKSVLSWRDHSKTKHATVRVIHELPFVYKVELPQHDLRAIDQL